MHVQAEALRKADAQITEWGIEHNELGERADAFLYCVEVKPEGCDYYIPLSPSWLIGEKSKVVAKWHRVPDSDRLAAEILVVADAELILYKEKKGATVIDSRVVDPFDATRSWSLEALRGAEGLRRWTHDDVVPRIGDVYQERLYCIRWLDALASPFYTEAIVSAWDVGSHFVKTSGIASCSSCMPSRPWTHGKLGRKALLMGYESSKRKRQRRLPQSGTKHFVQLFW